MRARQFGLKKASSVVPKDTFSLPVFLIVLMIDTAVTWKAEIRTYFATWWDLHSPRLAFTTVCNDFCARQGVVFILTGIVKDGVEFGLLSAELAKLHIHALDAELTFFAQEHHNWIGWRFLPVSTCSVQAFSFVAVQDCQCSLTVLDCQRSLKVSLICTTGTYFGMALFNSRAVFRGMSRL